MEKFLAAVLVEQNQPLEIAEISLLDKLGHSQVLVKVSFSGLCGSQLGEIRGVKGPDKFLPHLLGHEGGGLVVDIGPGVSTIKKNDNVVMHWKPGNGNECRPPKYKWGKRTVNAGFVTTLNQFAIVSENRLTKIPDSYSHQKAALFGCAVTTGLGVIENNADLKMGQTILIVGAGGVGLNIIQGAALHSAQRIVAVDLFQNRLELAKHLGATDILLSKPASKSWAQEARNFVGQHGYDVVVDNTGNPDVIEACFDLTGSNGKTVLVGVPAAGSKTQIGTLPLHFGKIITGSHGGNGNPTLDIPRYMGLERKGTLKLDKLFTEHFKLTDINSAIEKMENGSLSGRALIDCRV